MALTYLSGTDEYIGKKKNGKKKHLVAKIAMAPARLAFMAATRVNLLKLATRLEKIYKRSPLEINNFWDKFGGDHEKLKKAVEKGVHHKINGAKMGAEPTTIAAGITSALPIIIKAIMMFKKNGVHDETDEKSMQNFTEAAQVSLSKDPSVEKGNAILPAGETTGKITTDAAIDENGNPVKKPFYKNKKVLIGAGIGLLAIGTIIVIAKRRKRAD